ncbi:MAG: hypothetical protein HYR63_19145 [Proteobacteria bacterium]|nr:hypothetical protein [Pseudomonadota bacterium]
MAELPGRSKSGTTSGRSLGLDEATLARIIAKRLPKADLQDAISRIREAARWYHGLRRAESALPHRRRSALKSGGARMRRALDWLETYGAAGTTTGELMRWAAGKIAAERRSSAAANRGSAWAQDRLARGVVERGVTVLGELERSIALALAVARGKPGDKTDLALAGLIDDLCGLWADRSGQGLSARGKPLMRFVLEVAELIDPALADGGIRHALRVVVENRQKRTAKSAALR